MRKALGVVISVVVSTGALAAVQVPSVGAERDVVLSRGHIDAFEVTYDQSSSKLVLKVKDDTQLFDKGTVYRDPSTVVIDADHEKAAFTVPEGLPADYAFLGDPGSQLYMIPEVQDAELPWPGWSTERLRASLPGVSSATDAVTLDLDIEGPGEVHSFMSGSFGNVINRYVDTTDEQPERIPVGSNNHVHTNWVFTKQGMYTMTVTPTAELTAGGSVTGDPAMYEFHVGDPIAPIAPVAQTAPHVVGQVAVGATLFGADGDWFPSPTAYTRQWLRDGQPIEDATGSTYAVTAADEGAALTFRTTPRIGRATATATSAPVTVLGDPPSATARPSATGSAKVGGRLTASPGAWNVAGLTYSYQWLRDGSAIAGARGATYAPSGADHRRAVSVRVTATRTGRPAGVATSAARTIAVGAKLRASTKPKVSGIRKVGRTLKVSKGRWTPKATSYTYRWKADGKTIKGAAKRTLKLKKAHKGKKITVTVTAKRAGHTSGVASRSAGKVR